MGDVLEPMREPDGQLACAYEPACGISGSSTMTNVQLAFLVLLTGFAGLVHVHPVVWPEEQPSSRIDAPSLVLIVIISCLCLLASLWAVLSGTDLGANVL
jgi:hypothetical protein